MNPVYQSNQDTEEFKSTWAEVWAYLYVENHGQICFENALMVDAETGRLGLKTWTKRRRDFNTQDYRDYLSNGVLVKDKGFSWCENPLGIEKYVEDIGVISAAEKEQKETAKKITEIIRDYLQNL